MSNHSELEALRRGYRGLRAPAYLQTRVRANLPEPANRSGRWLPVGAAASLLLVAGLVFVVAPREPATVRVPSPSFARLSGVVPAKPKQLTLSLSGVRVPAKPPTPARPSTPVDEPQAGLPPPPGERLT